MSTFAGLFITYSLDFFKRLFKGPSTKDHRFKKYNQKMKCLLLFAAFKWLNQSTHKCAVMLDTGKCTCGWCLLH